MKKAICLFLLLCLVMRLQGQDADSTKTEKKLKIIPLPALFYTPETRLGYGALVSGIFNLGNKTSTRNSNGEVLAAYTLNKQVILRTRHNIFAADEKYVLNGEWSYYDFPILYYGIGNDTKKEFEENLEYKVLVFRERALKKIKEHWFAGIQYRYTKVYDLVYNPVYLVADKPLLEDQTGANSGIGISTIYDSRDNVLNASHGLYAEFSTFFHGKYLGSDFNYSRLTFDVRKFWPLNDEDVIAAQYFAQLNTDGAPFREMAQLGGEMIMRGYYQGRFRDNQQMALQAEYRKQIISWIGLVAFGAVGDVAHEFTTFDLGDFKYTVGGGLRFMVNKSDRLNIRIDYGVGHDTSGFYFAFAEAF